MNRNMERLLGQAAQVLTPGESVLDSASGMIPVRRAGQNTSRSGIVMVTDRRVVLFTKKIGGYDMQDFAYGLLASVEHKKGVMFGNLSLAAAGDRSHVSQIPKHDVERIAQLIRARMAAAHEHGRDGHAQGVGGVAAEIRELAALRDEGLLTDEQFEEKKRSLLSS